MQELRTRRVVSPARPRWLAWAAPAALAAGTLAAEGCATAVTLEEAQGSGGAGGGGGPGGGPGSDAGLPDAPLASDAATDAADAGVADALIEAGPIACQSSEDCAALTTLCSLGVCNGGFCQIQPINELSACDDGLFCTENDACKGGACVGGTPKPCPSSDACHVGICDEAIDACKEVPGNDGAQCQDDDPCTLHGVCLAGVCSKGPPIDCTVLDTQCTKGVCDPVKGCVAEAVNEGKSCNDGKNSPCTQGQCQSGSCVSLPTNEGGTCNDNLFCTINEKCQNGMCGGGEPNPCAPPGGCFIASCDEANDTCTAVPGNDGAPCDDFSPCTVNTTCSNGACINGQPANDGMPCDDGTECTTGEFCSAGKCGGGQGPPVYFSEDFKDNSKGWVLGPEWAIGPAKASFGGVFGADPAEDHTPTADNGIAGVVIGGNASTANLHPMYWLESPAFDTSKAEGPVVLGFRRWLNSDYDPFMHNAIEVWDGTKWVQLWKTGGPPGIQDSPPEGMGWTFVSHDVTAYKNAAMRVRFGFDITSGGVFTIGSWNLDDILVAGAACP